MKIGRELMKGSTPLLLLKLLFLRDMYGYEMIKTLEVLSQNTFHLKEGSLYPVLHALEEDGFVSSYWEDTDSRRKKKYYHITEAGKKKLTGLVEEWNTYADGISLVIR
ncbi:MAG: PadR family transcriptional regulator [Eubacteriales bacterium]|nr:PadR family transcriptional regulator [Eubacteriales bacterium]